MTDPVTNVEIEDVLSSIRRLVTENVRSDSAQTSVPIAGHSDAKQVEPPTQNTVVDMPDKLVLTPALRVADSAAAESSERRDPAEDRPAEAQAHDVGSAVLETVQDAVEHMVQDELHDENAWGDATEQAVFSESADCEALTDEAAADIEQEDIQPPSDDLGMSTLKTRIADLEAVVADRDDQWEPDGEGSDDYAGSPVEALPWQDHTPDDEEPFYLDQAEKVEAFQDDMLDPEGVSDAADDGAWNDTAQGDDTLHDLKVAGYSAPIEDDGPALNDQQESVDLFGSDDTVLDEEALREMVADIVRQELQGSLGERITRNVRKLVRREIHRALAAQELD